MSSSRRQYPFHLIEPKWQQVWDEQQAFRAFNPGESVPDGHPFGVRHNLSGKIARAEALPGKFYILDMFPYPSGAGLHVGHPEGYTATDILARYKRAQGFNVLHPMGWDSFGLPAEQYAVKTGQHPRQTTEENITTFKRQIKALGFSYDWSRELATTDTDYFKWTQWIFLKLYNSWFNPKTNKAEPIETLEYSSELSVESLNGGIVKSESNSTLQPFNNSTLESARRAYRDSKRLAYVSEQPVWWCEQLGTVLANEEVVDGKSEVGGFPVVRKPMRQWMLRITAYAERLIQDLDTIDWTDSLKEMQRNWIGRSEGAEVDFQIVAAVCDRRTGADTAPPQKIRVFTTRPDTLFGATYMVLAPEHKLVDQIMPSAWPSGTPVNWKGGLAGQTSTVANQSGTMADKSSTLSHQSPTVGGKSSTTEQEMSTAEHKSFAADGKSPGVVAKTSAFIAPSEGFASPSEAIAAYRAYAANKSDLERTELAKEKTGMFTGAYAINPVNGEKIPIWIADYVLASYGTGAIMAVPAHDERDYEFAETFSLPIRAVVVPEPGDSFMLEIKGDSGIPLPYKELCKRYIDNPKILGRSLWVSGISVNSSNDSISLNGLKKNEAIKKITAWLEEKGLGKKTINFKLRDWLFSRQRYWGEPFPIVWKKDAAGNLFHEALPESALPVLPPSLTDYKPTATGEPPLARAKDWVNLPDGSVRETNTMPQWAGSCWYYLRYLDAKNSNAFVGSDAESYWMGSFKFQDSSGQAASLKLETENLKPKSTGVDLYVGGTEHAVLHLLYARFWHKVLFDLGFVSTPEPFFKLVNQGIILGEDGQKMSKSRGNVVNPDDVLGEYGADAFRLYEMFMGPLEMVKPWNTKGVEGVYRFLGRAWRLFVDEKSEVEFEQAETTAPCSVEPAAREIGAQRRHYNGELLKLIKLNASIKDVAATPAQLKALHACIKKVTEDLDGMRFNTAISAMMVFVNDAITWETKPVSVLREFLILLQPFAPHIAEELWDKLNSSLATHHSSLGYAPWPKFNPELLVESEIELPVSVNGKMRDVIKIAADADNATIEAAAKASEKVQSFIAGKAIKKVIIVPKKMVNLIVG